MPADMKMQFIRQRRFGVLASTISQAIKHDTGHDIRVEIEETGGDRLRVTAVDLDDGGGTPSPETPEGPGDEGGAQAVVSAEGVVANELPPHERPGFGQPESLEFGGQNRPG